MKSIIPFAFLNSKNRYFLFEFSNNRYLVFRLRSWYFTHRIL